MSLAPIRNRIKDLAGCFPTAEDELRQRRGRFLARLNDDELERPRDIRDRYQQGQPPTEEELHWFNDLQAKYGHIRRDHESL